MLLEILARQGIDSFGVCPYDPEISDLRCRGRTRIPAGAKTVIVCAFPYATPLPSGAGTVLPINLARYAWIKDYHDVCGSLLAAACEELSQTYPGTFVWFCDCSPLREKAYAYRAGLGRRGYHSLILNPKYGSYFFIGTIVTDLAFPGWDTAPSPMGECDACGRCVAACPQGCISTPPEGLSLCERGKEAQGTSFALCLSHLTQKKGALSPQEETAIAQSGVIWGCDVCQQCCPHNQNVLLTHISAFLQDVVPTLTAENLYLLMQSRPFSYRGQAVMQRNLALCERFS